MISFDRGRARRCFSAFKNIYGFQFSGLSLRALGILFVAGGLTLGGASSGIAGPDGCDSIANTAVCSGDQSDGIATGSDGVENDDNVLVVESLTANIAPASGTDGIRFTPNSEDPIEANVTLGGFAIVTTGDADGVLVESVATLDAILQQSNSQSNENEQSNDNSQSVGFDSLIEQVQESLQSNNNSQEIVEAFGASSSAVGVEITGPVTAGSQGIVARSNASSEVVFEQTSEQTNSNLQEATGTGDAASVNQSQDFGQSNSNVQGIVTAISSAAGDAAVIYSGDLVSGGNGITAASEALLDISSTQRASLASANVQAASATATETGETAAVDQTQNHVTDDEMTNVTSASLVLAASATAGNASIDSSASISAEGSGLVSRSVADLIFGATQEAELSNDNSQTATATGTEVIIDQLQSVSQSNSGTLSVAIALSATSGDASIHNDGNILAGDHGIEALSSASMGFSLAQNLFFSNSNAQSGTGVGIVTGSQDQTVTQESSATIDAATAVTVTAGSVTVESAGDIASGSDAISAQSLASFDATSSLSVSRSNSNDQQTSLGGVTPTQTATQSNPPLGGERLLAANVSAGDVVVSSESTLDAQGHGIVARSIASLDFALTGVATSGTVTVTQDGDVTAAMHGILAESLATSAAIEPASAQGAITVTLESGTVLGGDGYYGVAIGGGTDNSFTNYGAVSSVSNQAILGGAGNETIDNYGMVAGEVILGAGTNAFNNMLGASFYSSATADLGGGLLTNDGTLNPGGPAAIETTALAGGLVQSADGDFGVDVDMVTNSSDRVDATGSAAVDGTVTPNIVNLASSSSTAILTAAGGVTDNGLALGVADSFFIDFELLYPTATEVLLEVTVDVTPEGSDLNGNQSEIGEHLNETLEDGIPEELAELYAELLSITDPDDLADFYDALSPEVFAQLQALALYGAADFADALMSCGGSEAPNAAIREGECVWLTGGFRTLDRDGDSETFGYEEEAWGLSGGVQLALDGNWRLGVAGGYERSDLDSRGGEIDGDHAHAGLVVKYSDGPLLLAGGVSGGYAWYDAERSTPLGRSSADPELGYVNGRLRAAYLFEPGGIYVKPMADLNVTYLHLNDFQESGAGAANLDVEDEDETILSFSPAVEIGGDADLGEGAVLRPFARVGFTVYSETEIGVGASFNGTPAGVDPFQVTTEIDRVVADLGLGLAYFTGTGLSFRLGYDGRFSDDLSSHALSGKAAIAF